MGYRINNIKNMEYDKIETIVRMITMLNAEKNRYTISEELGVSTTTIHRWIEKFTVQK